jgi:hypothetical protein
MHVHNGVGQLESVLQQKKMGNLYCYLFIAKKKDKKIKSICDGGEVFRSAKKKKLNLTCPTLLKLILKAFYVLSPPSPDQSTVPHQLVSHHHHSPVRALATPAIGHQCTGGH